MDTRVCAVRARGENVFTRANSTSDDSVNLPSLVYLVVFGAVYTVVRAARDTYTIRGRQECLALATHDLMKHERNVQASFSRKEPPFFFFFNWSTRTSNSIFT